MLEAILVIFLPVFFGVGLMMFVDALADAALGFIEWFK
jgi:hypothetical protein